MIIGINGRIKSGKDTVAKFIQEVDSEYRHGMDDTDPSPVKQVSSVWENRKFAGSLKQIASILTGRESSLFEIQDFKERKMDPIWTSPDGHLMTYRELLQRLGTEAIRNTIHPDAWVNSLMVQYNDLVDSWIITDMRFPNEFRAVKERGGITVRVTRPGTIREDEHISESAIDDHEFDFEIKNDTSLHFLKQQVVAMMAKHNLLYSRYGKRN